ncbi:hypothetical protein DLAC_00989 [Tieghemostelium lacteum]|uniref:HTTM-like domain-containing protein n=1 Tax=Tieghemostelium lacteum TaxID=361077 RepID=A0A152A7R6_TIELA|nr:hypothetical protein DLAC_00989 [Tieghemostelium lacteum]|eukprot:KYR02175.1 hypothetical protein DLAC_00989 [Tieghemostelium lacteum]
MQQMFGMDLRSIALFRMVMALCVIGDVIERMTDLTIMYTEDGIMPHHVLVNMFHNNYFFSIHMVNTSWFAQCTLFLLHIGFAFMMLIGYRTKTFSILTWFMTISLQASNNVVNHGGDVFFRMMLFINIFLPTGQMYSVDTATFANSFDNSQKPLRDRPESENSQKISVEFSNGNGHQHYTKANYSYQGYRPLTTEYSNQRYRVLSFATLAILVQMGSMYVASYFHKYGEEWKNGEAAFYALTLDYFATDFAKFLVQFREPLRLMTMAVYKWELCGIFFMSIPFFTDYFRLFAALGFFMLHLGFVSCLRLGLFFFVTAFAQVINIPPFVWDNIFNWLDKRILKGQRPLKVYYNTTSPLSQYTTLTLKTFFILPNTVEFSPMETMVPDDCVSLRPVNVSTPDGEFSSSSEDDNIEDTENIKNIDENGKLINKKYFNQRADIKSLYLYDDWLVTIDEKGIKRTNLQGLWLVCSKSPILFPLVWIFSVISDQLIGKIVQFIHVKSQQYQIRENRSLYQDRKQPVKPRSRIFGYGNNIWMAFICWFILAFNFNNFQYMSLGYRPVLNNMALVLRLDQAWGMFSPSPPKIHWWTVIHGVLVDGTPVELFKNEGIFNFEINTDVSYDKPDPFYKSYGNHRWLKYWEGFCRPNSELLRLALGRYICKQFNSKHSGGDQLKRFSIYFVYELQNLDGSLTPANHEAQTDHICLDS